MSRKERKQQDVESNRSSRGSGISKGYYIVIGILFLILFGLVIFIFSRSGDNVDVSDEDSTPPVEEVEEVEEPSNTNESQTNNDEETSETDETNEPNETETDEEETTEDEAEPDSEETVENVGETVVVSEEAPHDPSYAVNYDSGSSDRVAIKSAVMEATGLDNNLIEWWIGNNGPGQVIATVSDANQSIYYDVYLQYGDGNWHVTSYQRVTGSE